VLFFYTSVSVLPSGPADLASDVFPRESGVSTGVVVGTSIGGLVLGAIIGIVAASFFARNRYNKVRRNSSTDSIDNAAYIANPVRFKRTDNEPQPAGTPGPDIGTNQYLVEPFLPETANPTSPTQNQSTPAPTSSYSNAQSDGSGSNSQQVPHVYVVHHDAGGAPITVFTGGAGVTELPPSYVGRPGDQPNPLPPTPGNSNNPTDRRSRPGPVPRKSNQ